MSEHIAHIAVFEDAARLAQHSSFMAEVVQRTLGRHYDSALCGSASSGSGRPGIHRDVTLPMLRRARAAAGALPDGDPVLGRQFAFVLGWLAHAGADGTLDVRDRYRAAGFTLDTGEETATTPEMRRLGLTETEKQVYDDAFLFGAVYDGGRRDTRTPYEPLSPATLAPDMRPHPGAAFVDVAAVEPLVGALWQTGLLEIQSFYDDDSDLDAWVDTFFARRQEYMEDLRDYVAAFQTPDPVKTRYYIGEFGLYDADDPLIRLARSLQTSAPAPPVDLGAALATAPDQSLYAQALANAYGLMAEAGRYVEGGAEEGAVAAALGVSEYE